MVLYQNINVGQRVEVKIGNLIFRGVVKYKGAVVNKQGDWVGVALDRAGTYSTKVSPSIYIPYVSRRAGGSDEIPMENGDVTIGCEGLQNSGLCPARAGIEHGGFFVVPHLLGHGSSVFEVSSQGLPYFNSFPHRNQGGWGGKQSSTIANIGL